MSSRGSGRSRRRSDIQSLESRTMRFAHVLVDDHATTKLYVAVTDAYAYYEAQPFGLSTHSPGEGRTFARTALGTGKTQTLALPDDAKDTYDLANLTSTRAIAGNTVLMSFNDGTLWSTRDDAPTPTKIADVGAASLGRAVVFGGSLFFIGDDGHGVEIFKTDGTAKGTRVVPGFVKNASDDLPASFALGGDRFFFTAMAKDGPGSRLVQCDGTTVSVVPAMAKRTVFETAVVKGRVVAVSDGQLYLLAADLKSASAFATSRATDVGTLASFGKGIAFLSDGGVFYSDLTTRGTVRVGDAPAAVFGGFDTAIRFDPAGFMINAYTGYSEVHTSTGDPAIPPTDGPAVYRLTTNGLSKVLDGSFAFTRHLDGATYFFDDDDSIPGGVVARVTDAGVVTTLGLPDGAMAAASGTNAIAFAESFGGALYVIEPDDPTGAIVGNVFSDLNLNRKLNGSDRRILSGTAFADSNGNGRLDRGEPSAAIGSGADGVGTPGQFTLTGLRPGHTTVVVDLGSNYRGGVITRKTSVAAHDVANIDLLATPRFATIRVEAFNDLDGDGTRDAGETGAGGVLAYLDLDNDSTIDVGEPTQTSGNDGIATFARLSPGLFRVRVKRPTGEAFTTEAYTKIRVAPDGSAVVQVGVHASA